MMRLLLRLALLLALSVPAWATVYYVSAAGSDGAPGTATTSSWLHAPGMPLCTSVCASTAIHPGDSIILRGGDTWHANNSGAGGVYMGGNWNFTAAGSPASLIYIGSQKNWYTGASWVKPVFTGDNPVFNGTSFPSSCTYDYGTPTQKVLIQIAQYVQFDNIEYTGDCWSGSASGFPGILYAPGNDTLTNLYCHGYTMTSTSSDAVPCIASQGSNNEILHNVFGGLDTPQGAAGSAFCTNSPAGAPCTTGEGIYDAGAEVAFNVFQHIRVGGVLVDSEKVHDNIFEYMAPAPISSMGVQHDDAIMYYHGGTSASGVTEYLYNNVVRHNWINEQFYIPVSGGSTAYIFGNVFYDNHNAAVGNCIQLNAQSSGTQTLMLYNNTIDQDTDNSSGNTNGCKITFWGTTGGNSFGIPWTGPVITANNHLIGLSTIGSLFGSNSGATFTITQNGGDLLQPTATARAQGYTETDNPIGDSPQQGCTPATCSTVQAGTNQSAQILTFSPDTFGSYSYATSGGAAAVSEFGGVQAVYPAIYQNPRPAVWDIGAFQLVPIQTFNFNADNLYCSTVGCTPSWGTTDGPATLPTIAMNTAAANTPSPGSVINVGSSAANLTSALAAATCGETLSLTAGAVYSGNFTIPVLACSQSNWLTITTAGLSSLPPQGTRTSPCYSGVTSLQGRPPFACPVTPGTYTAQIITPNTNPAIAYQSGTSYVRLVGLEITRTPGAGFTNYLISLGSIGNISNIIHDRIWCHGDENIDETQRCLEVSAASNIAVIDSYLNDFFCMAVGTCSDSQAVIGGLNNINSTVESGFKFVNNFAEASGENILFGGGGANTVPTDGEVRLNTFFKPRQWNFFDPAYVPGPNGNSYEVKNLFEIKNAARWLIEGNTLQNSWAQAQNGSAFLLTAVNQGGLCPLCADYNITARYNTINTSCTPFELALVNNGSGDAAGGNHYSIHDIVADNQGYATGGCTTGQPGLELTEDTAITSPTQTINNVTLNHNTIAHAASRAALQAIISLTGPTIASGGVMYNIALTNDLMWSGSQGTSNEQGGSHPANCANIGYTPPSSGIPQCWSPYTVAGNCFVNNGSNTWPGTNVTSVASFTAAFNTYNGGNAGSYTVAPGACQAAATDGLDIGANIARLNLVLAGAPATFPQVLTAVQPPTQSTQVNYSAYQAILAQNSPLLPMQTVIAGAGNSQTVPIPLYIDSESGTGACSVTPSFTTLDAVIGGYKATSIIIAPALEGGSNGGTSKCVWSQAQANASALTWTATTHYLPGEYICIGTACTNPTPSGKYWQIQTGCYPGTGYDNTCVSGGTIPSFPACITGCTVGTTTVADGSGPTAFNWVYEGSGAPLQDSACNFSYKCGNTTTNCWLANGSADIIINSGSLGPCTLNELWQSLPIPSELPIRNWYNQIIAAVIAHYNGNPKVGYIRFGGVAGGELGPLKSSEWPWYGSTTQQNRAQFLSWVNKFDAGIMGNSPTVPIYSNFNVAGPGFTDPLYADQEALLAVQYNFNGLDTNGAQLYDILNLLGTGTQNCAFPLTLGTECTTSDWAPIFATYLTNSAGAPMHHVLQSATGSTPLNCSNTGANAVIEGPMGALPASSTYCTAGYPGMLPFLYTIATTGIGSPSQTISVDTYELYTNAFTGTSPTQPASDVLLALSNNYTATTNSQAAYLPQKGAYVSAFCTFLGINCASLTITVAGSGTGIVADNLSQVSCAPLCSATYLNSTVVTLTATPSGGASFVGWSGGGCSGTGTCVVTMSTAQSVTATFSGGTSYGLTTTIVGSGSVSSSPAGIACPPTCTASYASGTVVALTPTPGAGYIFTGWSGACTGTGGCSVTMNAAEGVTATFSLVAAPEGLTATPGIELTGGIQIQ